MLDHDGALVAGQRIHRPSNTGTPDAGTPARSIGTPWTKVGNTGIISRNRVLAHGSNTTAAATALRQITARLTEQHGAAAVRDLTNELAGELAVVISAGAWINNGDGNSSRPR